MNRVNATGRPARQRARADERRRRGLPPRRRRPAAAPSSRLQSVWPGAGARRPVVAASTRLLVSRPPSVSLAPRATAPAATRVPRPAPPVPVPPRLLPALAKSVAPAVEVVPDPVPDPVPTVVPTPAPTPWSEVQHVDVRPSILPLPPSSDPALIPSPGRRRPRRALLLTGAAVVVLAGAGTAVGVVASRTDGPPAAVTTAVAGPDAGAAASWLTANVAAGAPVLSVDPVVTAALEARGVDVTTVSTPSAAGVGTYLVDATDGDLTPDPVADDRSLVPVVRFGDDATGLEVGQVVARSADEVSRNQRAERDTAATATAGLLTNPALTVTAVARPAFAAGDLDLRAAAFLAVLAGTQSVQVLAVPQDAAELAAGQPNRRLVVAVGDPAALRAAVGDARTPFAPVLSAADPAAGDPTGSVLLTWPVLADPTLVVS